MRNRTPTERRYPRGEDSTGDVIRHKVFEWGRDRNVSDTPESRILGYPLNFSVLHPRSFQIYRQMLCLSVLSYSEDGIVLFRVIRYFSIDKNIRSLSVPVCLWFPCLKVSHCAGRFLFILCSLTRPKPSRTLLLHRWYLRPFSFSLF